MGKKTSVDSGKIKLLGILVLAFVIGYSTFYSDIEYELKKNEPESAIRRYDGALTRDKNCVKQMHKNEKFKNWSLHEKIDSCCYGSKACGP